MPRLSNSLPRYRKHRASGQAVVTLCGVDHYLGPHGTKASKRQYDRLVAEWLENGRQLVLTECGTITLVELCACYWKFAKEYYVKDGRCTKVAPAIRIALSYVKTWYGRDPVTGFGPLALKAIRQRMIDEGLSRRYINDHVARIVRMFKWGVGEQLVPPDGIIAAIGRAHFPRSVTLNTIRIDVKPRRRVKLPLHEGKPAKNAFGR